MNQPARGVELEVAGTLCYSFQGLESFRGIWVVFDPTPCVESFSSISCSRKPSFGAMDRFVLKLRRVIMEYPTKENEYHINKSLVLHIYNFGGKYLPTESS